MTNRFSLTLDSGAEFTIDAEDSGRTWNGFPVPILTAEQAAVVAETIGDPYMVTGEASGLTWSKSPMPTRRDLMADRDAALKAGDIATFQALTVQIAALPMKGVRKLTPNDIARYAAHRAS